MASIAMTAAACGSAFEAHRRQPPRHFSAARRQYHGAVSPHVSIDRDAVSAFCQRHHIARLALFGSVLRDDFGPDSDVDVLVEFRTGHVPGFNFVSIEREFSGLLHGRRVDMVTPKLLNPRIRDQILSRVEPLYVAA
jgi:predicted nucleotidyltransferase